MAIGAPVIAFARGPRRAIVFRLLVAVSCELCSARWLSVWPPVGAVRIVAAAARYLCPVDVARGARLDGEAPQSTSAWSRRTSGRWPSGVPMGHVSAGSRLGTQTSSTSPSLSAIATRAASAATAVPGRGHPARTSRARALAADRYERCCWETGLAPVLDDIHILGVCAFRHRRGLRLASGA